MDSYSQLNEVLVHLFNHTLKIEEESLIRDEFKDISMNDMHIIAVSYTHLDVYKRQCEGNGGKY